jgi:glycerophosphoryl diester phosphodiesterase
MHPPSSSSCPFRPRLLAALLAAGAMTSCANNDSRLPPSGPPPSKPQLFGRAVLEAATFAEGPPSGEFTGTNKNGVQIPFPKQPVQGFSGVLDNHDGTFLVTADNGYGALENSADFHLRVYTVRPSFKSRQGGTGTLAVEKFFELRDPDKKVPFAITNHFTQERVLTGADFDIESIQRAKDGTFWFGDEFGPFLLHTDATGKVLEAPIRLPDFDTEGKQLRSPQNPLSEEASAVRVMNAVRAHARAHGNRRTPVFSPWYSMLDDGDAKTGVPSRLAPPVGSGLAAATSDVFNVASMHAAGYSVVTWTVNTPEEMRALLALKVDGIISDRPDLLLEAVRGFDANGDGTPGDYLGADGLIDPAKFDAQGHRGGRNLRPENTLPAMEVALDHLMTTLELDTGISADGVPLLDHDPSIEAAKCRRADGAPYEKADQVLVKSLSAVDIQSTFICDKIFRGPSQLNDPALSPVTQAFAAQKGLPHVYVMPTLRQVFDFVKFYAGYYKTGAGQSHPDAARRVKNAERVRFNIETKLNPRAEFAARTVAPGPFADAVVEVILDNALAERADVQSFDFRTLLHVQEKYPQVRTAYLFGDFPLFADRSISGSDEGTNLQPEGGASTPWLGGLPWPYRSTAPGSPFRVRASGGFEGMALTPDGKKLLPLLEKPLVGGKERTLLFHEFDLESRRFTGVRYEYVLEEKGMSVADFILFDDTHGLAIERDNFEREQAAFKALYEVKLVGEGKPVQKRLAVDLLHIANPYGLATPLPEELGLGEDFSFPFFTIEDVVVFDRRHIGVINDNNYPFSAGRRAGKAEDTEFILIELDQELGGL